MSNRYYVYVYCNPFEDGATYGVDTFDKKPFYVGKGTKQRYREHVWNFSGTNTGKIEEVRSILARGVEPLILLYKTDLSEKEALDEEKRLVLQIGRLDKGIGPLHNRTDGGDRITNCTISEEGKENIRKANKAKVQSPEFRARKSWNWSGERNPNYGGKITRGLKSPLKGRKRPESFGQEHSAKLKIFFSNPENRLKMSRPGEMQGNSKLTREEVIEIRRASGCTLKSLAQQYKVTVSTISGIKSNKSWKHLLG